MTAPDAAAIARVVAMVERMVAADQGRLSVRAFDAAGRRLEVDYDKGRNDRCESCVIDDRSIRDFLAEALTTHKMPMHEIVVHQADD